MTKEADSIAPDYLKTSIWLGIASVLLSITAMWTWFSISNFHSDQYSVLIVTSTESSVIFSLALMILAVAFLFPRSGNRVLFIVLALTVFGTSLMIQSFQWQSIDLNNTQLLTDMALEANAIRVREALALFGLQVFTSIVWATALVRKLRKVL
jgi:hypothetical protein